MTKRYAVGDHLTAPCATCQMACKQTIIALESPQTVTGTCDTCGHESSITLAAAPKARVARAKNTARLLQSAASRWEAKMAGATGEEQQYTMTAQYHLGDIVLHEQFGKGVVVKLATQKCLVLFQDQERMMVSANVGEAYRPFPGSREATSRR